MSDPSATGDWTRPAASAAPAPPVVPGYEILAELGRGGMGVVCKARHSSGKLVALKLLRDGALAGRQERERFRIEWESASRLCHPNIVQIFDVGEHDGRPYYAMELVEGGTLERRLHEVPLPMREAAELLRTLALAIQHAHERQIVHRDLKPANILLADGIPKIADFGLAKRLDAESTALTRTGAVLGTPAYMSPEQAAGKTNEIGPATDVYGLGAILYAVLTGRPPFQAETWAQIVEQVLHGEPELPTRLRPEVPRELEAICLKCLEKEPGRRYSSAQALADDLVRFIEGQPIAAEPVDPLARLKRLAARDGFEIVERIGRGPRSVVYRALLGTIKQPVALKFYDASLVTQEDWEARLREGAGLWATLSHPQIVPPQRGGWWDGSAYLAAEQVPQGSLADRLADPPRAARTSKEKAERLRQALQLAEQTAEAVCYLHRQGVVHGNLKPSNVLLSADGVPRLIDFRATSPEAHADVAWLPSELLKEPDAEARPYTDIYGLGLILYAALTGQPPFAATNEEDLREQVATQEPRPPSDVNPAVPPPVEAICLTCLRKKPFRRFMRAYDVLSALRREQGRLKLGASGVRRDSSG